MAVTREAQTQEYDALIVGMGPVGLAAAYELAKNGNKVCLIEKRKQEESAARPQVIILDPLRKQQLIKMIRADEELDADDIKFLDSLAYSAVKISSIQKFILNRIKNLDPPMVDIKYETEITSMSVPDGTAQFKAKEGGALQPPIQFKHLIAADGAGSSTLELLNRTQPDAEITRTTPATMQHLEQTYHLGAYVKLSRKDGGEITLSEREFTSSFLRHQDVAEKKQKKHFLYFMRFDKKSYGRDKKNVKLMFIGEIPQLDFGHLSRP